MRSTQRWLLALLVLNVVASILHYVDNIVYFHHYPEPPWMNRKIIDGFWFVMTPFAVVGYLLYRKGARLFSYLCLYLYAAMSLLVLGHYRFGSFGELSFRINFLILLEAAAALALIAYVLWLQLRSDRPGAHR